MTVHVLKCEPGPFAALVDGRKTFEWRKEDDRSFREGDLLVLLEHRSYPTGYGGSYTAAGYTGELQKRFVTYVLRGQFGVPEGYAVLGLAGLTRVGVR